MRLGAVLRRRHDRREGRLGALLAHPGLGEASDIEFGSPLQAPLGDLVEDLVGKFGCGSDRIHLGVVLIPTQLLHDPGSVDELYAIRKLLFEPPEHPHGDRRLVVADPPFQPRGERGQHLALGDDDLEDVAKVSLQPLRVAEIRHEQRLLGPDDRGSARARESGQPAQVEHLHRRGIARTDQPADEQAGQLALGDDLGEPADALGDAHRASFPASRSSASR